MCDTKIMMLQKKVASEEDTLTTTPRSFVNSEGTTAIQSPESSLAGSRCASKCEEEVDSPRSSTGTQEDDAYYDEYTAFLREMAGSFEDDGSEVSSDEGSDSDEDEDSQPIGRKRSSWCSFDDDDPVSSDNGLIVSPRAAGHGKAHKAGGLEEEKEEEAQSIGKTPATLLAPATQLSRVGCPVSQGTRQGRQMPPPTSVEAPQGLSTTAARRRDISPSSSSRASRDNRAPVVDDYDVAKATLEFAQQRTGKRLQQQCEDLTEAIQLRTSQAQKLYALLRKPQCDPEIRSHYARTRSELLVEVTALEVQLESLQEAQRQPQTAHPTVYCLAGGAITEAMMFRQETHFGDSVAVQC